MPPRPLQHFEIQKYYQSEAKFNGLFVRNNLPKIKNEVYAINLDEFKSIGTHWIALYANANTILHFDSLEVELVAEEIKQFIGNKNIITNIYRIHA